MSRVNLALRLSVLVFLSIVALMVAVDWIIGLSVPGDRRPALLLFVSVALIGGLIVAFALDRMVVKPIQSTIGQVRSTSNEDWRKVIEPQGGPEMQELGHALEQLRADLVAERDQLERRVEERTEQLREAERQLGQQARLAALGQLAAGVAHEVNNPNGVVLSRVGYLLKVADDEGLDPDVIEDLETIEHQSQRVASIAGNLLQFGRTTPGGMGPVVVTEVLELSAGLLRHQAGERSVEVVVDADPGHVVDADRDALEQVVFNLVRNALDACDEGRVTLRSHVDGFSVEDQGRGIDPDVLPRIFEPFFTTKGVGRGTGLGLSVSYGIVSEHGGRIEVDSTPGAGTTFRVHFA
ncbi:MAG TPA: ATP-binding protein [Myxococcota bacterium]|nr:ATP-binding protein [Myxococcota bacterium]